MISIAFFLSKLLHNACCEKKPSKKLTKSKNQFVLGYWLSGGVPFMTRYCLQSCYKMLQQKRITKLIQQKSDMCFFQGWSSEAADILPTKIRFFFPFRKKNSATNNQWNILLQASDYHEFDCESKWGFTLLYWVCTPMCPPPPACSLKSLTWSEVGTLPELLEGEGCWKCCFFSAADEEAEVEEDEDDGTPVLLLRRSASCLIACSSSESISSMLKPQQSASIACFLQTEKNPPTVIPTLATCNKLQESPPSHGVTQIHIPATTTHVHIPATLLVRRHCCAKSRTEFPHSFFHPITCCCCRSHESSLCNPNAPRYSACLQKSNAHLHNLKVLLPLQEQLRSIVLGCRIAQSAFSTRLTITNPRI